MRKLLFDFLPLLLFFAAFKLLGIYGATAVAMTAALLQIGFLVATGRTIEPMHWVNVGVIVVFGGLTLFLQDETFIKWKPTVLYWVFGGALLVGQFAFGRNLIRKMLEKQISLPDPVWNRLNLAWAAFFTFAGALNIVVAYTFPTETWVNFKVFGLMGLLLAFIVAQSFYIGRFLPEE
jgi:intracellular septation protein